MCLAVAEKVLWPIICRLSSNNRPITDYLKNSRLIGFADYLPINRLIPIIDMCNAAFMGQQTYCDRSALSWASCLLDLHSTTQVVSRLHAPVLGKSCVV
jgi:hypothetical protein